uniref:Uncharacterized protein MANES_12G069800 n=1 Tax=Rhizophora mucronata TaxID=61149 RepID=A0A2P2JJV8_RHIMU
MKTLRKSLLLSSELQRTLYGFIVFEVAWSTVRGINYSNELQADTSLAIEAKTMQRWEFDSITQAANCISLWFSGTSSEQLQLRDFLDSVTGEVFYDAEDDFARAVSIDDEEDSSPDNLWSEASSSHCLNSLFDLTPGMVEANTSEPHTPPPIGPYKRRRVNKSIGTGFEVNFCSEKMQGETPDSLYNSETCTSDSESSVEAKLYQDVLVLFRFNDHDLPFKLRQIIMSDLRLLTLLEAGLPSWVIFLQSYPVFCHLYRPWMCPLARALYVLISVVTVLIGFYDLYKNVPVLKASLWGPLFDWIESWEMVSRIKYLGTMLFLHNFEKAVKWFLMLTRTMRSFFSVFTQPLVEPVMEILGFVVPVWNMFMEVAESLCSVVWVVISSTFTTVGGLIEFILWPMWFVILIIWNTGGWESPLVSIM